MARRTITAAESIWVARPPGEVFAYTQDYATRPDWDPVIRRAEILATDPPAVRVEAQGVGTYTVEYRLFRPGERTSAAFRDVASSWLAGGGGPWEYRARDGGTDWTQTNTLELRHPRLLALAAPMVERRLRDSMRTSMARAKAILEAAGGPSADESRATPG